MTVVRTPPDVFDGFVNARGDLDGASRQEVCACGCGAVLRAGRKDARYASAACRTRAYRSRREAPAKASQRRHGGKGQRVRVLAALHAVGRRGITQVDWLRHPTPDLGPPITRLAARINELRDEGYRIEHRGRRDSCVVYVLTASPAPGVATTTLPTPDDQLAADAQIAFGVGEAA